MHTFIFYTQIPLTIHVDFTITYTMYDDMIKLDQPNQTYKTNITKLANNIESDINRREYL